MSEGTRALVTGAGGFIGSHLVERLVRGGYRVRAFVHYNATAYWHNLELVPPEVRERIEVFSGDVADAFSVDRAVEGQDVVFHLASLIAIPYSYVAPAAYVSSNVTGTLNVLQACRRHGTPRLVHTSTSEVYGTGQYVPMDEKHPLVGQSPYSATKIAADKLVESFFRSYELPAVTVRPFNTYGPRQSARAVIPTIITQALERDRIEIGSLTPVRDFTFVTDTAEGFVAASTCDRAIGETVNLGVGQGVSIGDVIDIVREEVGRDVPVRSTDERMRPEASEVQRLISDNRKMRSLSGWAPKVDFREGIRRTIAFAREHRRSYKVDQYNV